MNNSRPIERGDTVRVLEGTHKDHYGLAIVASIDFVSVHFSYTRNVHIIERSHLVLIPSESDVLRTALVAALAALACETDSDTIDELLRDAAQSANPEQVREILGAVWSEAAVRARAMSTYTVKTRTEKRLRARDVTTTTAHLDVRPLEEHVVYIAELFEDGAVVCRGEAAFERDAFTELDRAICQIAAAARAAHIAQIDALTEVRRWE